MLLSGLLGWAAWAAPLMPGRENLLDEVRTLAGLHTVRLVVELPAPMLTQNGFDAEVLRREWTQALEGAGFELGDDEDLPTIHVWAFARDAAPVPDAVSFFVSVTVVQDVRVNRLDQPARIPTWTGLGWGAMPNDGLADRVNAELTGLRNQFLVRHQQASAPD